MKTLKLAIQKSGRLHNASLTMLKQIGISIPNGNDQLKAKASNFPLEVLYLRNSDIPKYLQDGVVDVAIIGENLVVEKSPKLTVETRLGFSKCRLSIAVPKAASATRLKDLEGKRIATSYPNTLNKILEQQGVNAKIHVINGSVEIAPNIGLADAVCDIVSSGNTLFKNGLKEIETLLTSEAVLVTSPHITSDIKTLVDKITFRLQSVLQGNTNKYVLLNAPNSKIKAITALLPGVKSPTVLPLAQPGWCSLHSVINKQDFWEVIDALKANGAEGILVCPIENMIL